MRTAWLLLAVVGLAAARSGDSLGPALGAVRRRQRDLASYYSRPSYVLGQPEDIGYGYQKAAGTAGVFESNPVPASRLGARAAPAALDKLLAPFSHHHQSAPKRWMGDQDRIPEASAFRERAAALVRNVGDEAALIRNLGEDRPRRRPQPGIDFWEEFTRNQDPEIDDAKARDYLYLLAKASPEEEEEPVWRRAATDLLRRQTAFDERYGAPEKRYPVSKRSPKVASRVSSGTDPRTAKELSAIFSRSENSTGTPDHHHDHHAADHHPTEHSHEDHHVNKNMTTPATTQPPVAVRKKSVDWSQYFGMDRKKRGDRGDAWYADKVMAAHGLHGNGIGNRLVAAEDALVDRALKFTGANLARPADARNARLVRDRVAEELAAAYGLEQLRQMLEERQGSNKRGLSPQVDYDDLDWTDASADDDRQACPILEELEERCTQATVEAYDKDRVFLPLCMVQQMCVLCGGEGGGRGCDSAYLREAGSHCGNHLRCRATAEAILASLPPTKPEPAACAASCLAPFLLP